MQNQSAILPGASKGSDQRRYLTMGKNEEKVLKKIAETEAINKGIKPGPMGSIDRIK